MCQCASTNIGAWPSLVSNRAYVAYPVKSETWASALAGKETRTLSTGKPATFGEGLYYHVHIWRKIEEPRAKHGERLHNHWQIPWLIRPTAEHLKMVVSVKQ